MRAASWQLPMQWPQAEPAWDERETRQAERLLRTAIVFAMLALTVLDRFGVRITADYAIQPGMIALYGLAAALLAGGAAMLDARGARAYLALAGIAALSFLLNASLDPRASLSITSLLLIVVLYAPFAVVMRPGLVSPGLWAWTLKLYVGFALFLAFAGIAQFLGQFATRAEWLFDYTPLIPEALRASGGWNTVIPVGEWIKSNGFFLREPSIFSITMALALLCELALGARKWVIAVLATGLILTYSGSGLACLAVALLFPLGRGSVLRVTAGAGIGAAVFFLFGDALNLGFTLERLQEFGSERSSAYCRFIYPAVLVAQHADANLWAGLLGHGPGTMPTVDITCADGVETTYAKVLFEYGAIGALAIGALMLGALSRSAAPIRLRVALGFTWLLLGGNLVTSGLLLLVYLFCAMWPRGSAVR